VSQEEPLHGGGGGRHNWSSQFRGKKAFVKKTKRLGGGGPSRKPPHQVFHKKEEIQKDGVSLDQNGREDVSTRKTLMRRPGNSDARWKDESESTSVTLIRVFGEAMLNYTRKKAASPGDTLPKAKHKQKEGRVFSVKIGINDKGGIDGGRGAAWPTSQTESEEKSRDATAKEGTRDLLKGTSEESDCFLKRESDRERENGSKGPHERWKGRGSSCKRSCGGKGSYYELPSEEKKGLPWKGSFFPAETRWTWPYWGVNSRGGKEKGPWPDCNDFKGRRKGEFLRARNRAAAEKFHKRQGIRIDASCEEKHESLLMQAARGERLLA